jgi:hypothetical protein
LSMSRQDNGKEENKRLESPDLPGSNCSTPGIGSVWFDARGVLEQPRSFFESISEISTGRAIFFLAACSLFYSGMMGLITLKLNAFLLPLSSTLICTCVGSLPVFIFFRVILRGKGSFSDTLKVLAFSKAPLLFAWVPLGPIPLGGIVSILYTLVLNTLGLGIVHKRNPYLALIFVIGFTFLEKVLKLPIEKLLGLS